jgi:hypothetical protein
MCFRFIQRTSTIDKVWCQTSNYGFIASIVEVEIGMVERFAASIKLSANALLSSITVANRSRNDFTLDINQSMPASAGIGLCERARFVDG